MEQRNIHLIDISIDELREILGGLIDSKLAEFESKISNPQIEYLTRSQAADLLSVSLVTLHKWCNVGVLKPYRLGNRTYFKVDEIDQCLKRVNQL